MKLAFYTMGDTRIAAPARAGLTLSQVYQAYARAIGANEILTATTNAEAQGQLEQRVQRGLRYEQIIFVGHGLQGGYFFSGQPEGQDNFIAPNMSYVFDAGDTALMELLDQALNDRPITDRGFLSSPSIEFHSCYTGAGTGGLLPTLQEVLGRIRPQGHLVRILGYIHYFRWTLEVTSHGQIVAWHNAVVDPATRPPRLISGGTRGTLTPPAELQLVVARIPRTRPAGVDAVR